MRYFAYALTAALAITPAMAQNATIPDMTVPNNDAPNPYQTVKDYYKLPAGRTWGSTSAVEIDRDGKSIWVAERCGKNGCLDRQTGKNCYSIIKEMKGDYPELYDLLIVKRNVDWAQQLKTKLAGTGVSFVAVGSGHLVGADSVQAQLDKLGIKAERVE